MGMFLQLWMRKADGPSASVSDILMLSLATTSPVWRANQQGTDRGVVQILSNTVLFVEATSGCRGLNLTGRAHAVGELSCGVCLSPPFSFFSASFENFFVNAKTSIKQQKRVVSSIAY